MAGDEDEEDGRRGDARGERVVGAQGPGRHGGHVGEVPRADGGDVGAHGVGARATPVQTRRVDLHADASASITRGGLVEHAPVAAPEVPKHAVARQAGGGEDVRHAETPRTARKGLTERGPACDHGSSTYSSLLSTYSRASADCSASHRSRPTSDSLVDMAPKPRRGGVCDGRKRSASSSSAVRGGSTIRPSAKHFWRSAESN